MNNKAHLRPKDYDSNGDIIPSGWKEEKGDLISREALKTALNYIYDCAYIESKSKEGIASDIIDDIDNAPTVNYPFYAEAYQTGYEEALNNYSDWLKEQKTGFDYNRCEVLVDRNGIWESAIETYLKERSDEE